MAYMRGYAYIWDDGESRVHIWIADGYDGWDEASWHHIDDGKDFPVQPSHLRDGQNIASGVSVPQKIMDEYVVMRVAEMIDEGTLVEAIDRALSNWPRDALKKYAEMLKPNTARRPRMPLQP